MIDASSATTGAATCVSRKRVGIEAIAIGVADDELTNRAILSNTAVGAGGRNRLEREFAAGRGRARGVGANPTFALCV